MYLLGVDIGGTNLKVGLIKDKKIIDITKYTEEIAQGENAYYNNLFNSGVYLLKEKENKNG